MGRTREEMEDLVAFIDGYNEETRRRNEEYRLQLISTVQEGDTVYPLENNKVTRITRCVVTRRTSHTIWVRGVFWGSYYGDLQESGVQELPFDRYGVYHEEDFAAWWLTTQQVVDKWINEGVLDEETIEDNSRG